MVNSIKNKSISECNTLYASKDESLQTLEKRFNEKLKKKGQQTDDIIGGQGLMPGIFCYSPLRPMSDNELAPVRATNMLITASHMMSESICSTNIPQKYAKKIDSNMSVYNAEKGVFSLPQAILAGNHHDVVPQVDSSRMPENQLPDDNQTSEMKIFEKKNAERHDSALPQSGGITINMHGGHRDNVMSFEGNATESTAIQVLPHNTSGESNSIHNDISNTEMTWYFKSWGNNNGHSAKLIFTEQHSSFSDEVKIIASDDLVRSVLIRQQQIDNIPNIVIEHESSEHQDRDSHPGQQDEDEEQS